MQHSYITSVRGTTLLCTAICILAVDFHAFPRRFCKAEKFGQGKIKDICSILHFSTRFHSVHVLMLGLMLKNMLTCGNMLHRASFVAGSGLMDIGVGAFIFSSGISYKPAPLSKSIKLYKGFIRSLQRNSILLTIGEPCLPHITPEVMLCKLASLQQRRLTLASLVYIYTSFTLHCSRYPL